MNIDGHFLGIWDFENTDVTNSDLQKLETSDGVIQTAMRGIISPRAKASKEILPWRNGLQVHTNYWFSQINMGVKVDWL